MNTVSQKKMCAKECRRNKRNHLRFAWSALISLMLSCILFPSEINAGILDNLQAGEWIEVPNSNLSAVLPNPLPPGNSGPGSIMHAWSGGAYDAKRDRLLVWGGGHGDYGGNEVYAFDVETLNWSRIWGPSANIPAVGGPCVETYSDGNPVARHTYDGLEYLPNVDKFFSQGGSLYCGPGSGTFGTWLFDLTSHQWTAASTPKPLGGWTELSVVSGYDSNTGHVFIISPSHGLWEYNPTSNAWTQRSSATINGGMSAVVDPLAKKIIAVGSGAVYTYDISGSGTASRVTQSTSGDVALRNSSDPGIVYDPVSKLLVGWKGGATVYTLDTTSWIWTAVSPAQTNSVIPSQAPQQGTFGRWQYIPSKNLFIGVNSINGNVWVYKLRNGSGSPNPTDSTPPTVSISSPANGASVSGTLSLTASASDNIGVTSVQFKIDNANHGSEDLSSPYSISLNTTALSNGSHTLTAIARDAAGNTSTSSAISINVSNQGTPPPPPSPPPTGQLNIPTNTWVAVAAPTTDQGPMPFGRGKHVRWAFNPTNGLIYNLGGDFNSTASPDDNGNMNMWTYSIRTNTWTLEQNYCRTDHGMQPGGPDEVGWTYDTNRGVFWLIHGFGFGSHASRCPNGNVQTRTNLQYDPTTKTWSDPKVPLSSNLVWWEYNKFAHHDPVTDKIYSMAGNGGAKVLVLDVPKKSWIRLDFDGPGQWPNAPLGQEYSAFDPVQRVIYGIAPNIPKVLKFDIDSQTMSELPPPPIAPRGIDSALLFWNSVEKVLMYVRTDDPGQPTDGKVTEMVIYNPATNAWTTQAVTPPSGLGLTNVVGNSGIYDPHQNVLMITGSQHIPKPYLFLYRYSKNGGPGVDTTPPAPPANLNIN